jgi:glycosyltransferase involved in cell wall biosynthesis
MKKVLVLVPSPNMAGGISSYYSALKPHLNQNIKYFIRGRRRRLKYFDKIVLILTYLFDLLRFLFVAPFYSTILVNTSLGHEGIIRDHLYLRIAQFFGKITIGFFRGLDYKFAAKISTEYKRLFQKSFLRTDKIIVLSKDFKELIISLGFKNEIVQMTTAVDDELLAYDITPEESNEAIRLLFLSRVEKYKGIYEAVDAYKILRDKGYAVRLVVGGDGTALESVKNYVKDLALTGIEFTGYVEDVRKAELLKGSDIFFFPSYSEGLPNAILEALAFGLPIITSAVGGIPNIFENGKMGFITKSIEPAHLACLCEKLITDRNRMSEISDYNREIGKKYLASVVAKQLENVING